MDTISVSIDRNSTITTENKNKNTSNLNRNETFNQNQNGEKENRSHCGSLELTKSPLLDNEKKGKSFMAKICCCFYK